MNSNAAPLQFRRSARLDAAFTLAEVCIAAAVLAVFACASLVAFTQMNRFAANARLKTLAMAVAQQKVDLIQTAPWILGSAMPPVLTTAASNVSETNLPLDNDPFNNEAGLSSAYTNLDLQVTATRTTAITYPTSRLVAAVVTVSYKFRGKDFSVTLSTLRACDTI